MCFFFFNDTATTEIYTLSLHDALPISRERAERQPRVAQADQARAQHRERDAPPLGAARMLAQPQRRDAPREHRLERSEEHTSELQSQSNLVCRLLLEKKKNIYKHVPTI